MKSESVIKPPLSKALKSGRVILAPGEEIGEHVTQNREELIVILRGRATIEIIDDPIEVHQGQTHFIPEGIKHNVSNKSDEVLEYLYIVSLFSNQTESKP
jgi:quercetin dioxygenase-like cupin family protein